MELKIGEVGGDCFPYHGCRGAFHSRTMKRSSPSTKSGSVQLWSHIELMIRLRTPIP